MGNINIQIKQTLLKSYEGLDGEDWKKVLSWREAMASWWKSSGGLVGTVQAFLSGWQCVCWL